jgi:uncharacterized membrane protein
VLAAGAVFLPMTAMIALGAPLAGLAGARITPRLLAGTGMALLAAAMRLPRAVLGAGSLIVIGGHDLLDGVDPRAFGPFESLWRLVHVPGAVTLPWGGGWYVLYPLLPWAAVMLLGYALAPWMLRPAPQRRRLLATAGAVATGLFVVLRVTNVYGNPATSFMPGGPGHFHVYPAVSRTMIAFLDTEKYPASLQYLLMTLGPTLLLLAMLDSRRGGAAAAAIATFGRVPFFYYVCHLYLIHLAALGAGIALGQPWGWLGTAGGSPPAGYGYSLAIVWLVWLAVLLAMYPACRWFARVKQAGGNALLRFV